MVMITQLFTERVLIVKSSLILNVIRLALINHLLAAYMYRHFLLLIKQEVRVENLQSLINFYQYKFISKKNCVIKQK